jgi:hypothetical protein
MISRRTMAIMVMALLPTSFAAAAQHAPEPKAPAAKAQDASPVQTAAAVEQILRKLSQDMAKNPAPRSSTSSRRAPAPAPRLRLKWQLSLVWPAALTAPQAP